MAEELNPMTEETKPSGSIMPFLNGFAARATVFTSYLALGALKLSVNEAQVRRGENELRHKEVKEQTDAMKSPYLAYDRDSNSSTSRIKTILAFGC